MTVVFADIVGYTSISERLDHERVKALTDRCLKRLTREVERYGGYVGRYVGDSIMAVFGAPVAHDNDAERAVRASVAMHEAIGEVARSLGDDLGLELSLHVGINTGEALAGMVGPEYTVIGDAVNVAARLQGAAPAGTTLVGDRTRRATAEVVSYGPVGALDLKGKKAPVKAWEVVQVEPAGRFARRRHDRAPLIGRSGQLALLKEAFEQVAEDGLPQLVALIGEGGVGKTRLLHEFEQELSRGTPAARFLHGRAAGFGSDSAFGPLAQMVREQCAISETDDAGTSRRKLERALGLRAPGGGRNGQLAQQLEPLARLLGADPGPAAGKGEEEHERKGLFAAVQTMLIRIASDKPIVLVWEDAQWADEGTLALIDHLAAMAETPLLQVCIGRDELLARRPRWAIEAPGRRSVFLEPLDRADALALIDTLIGSGGPEASERAQLARRTGGNPLFAEALVDSLAESEGPTHLPETVKGMLATRLDGLEPFQRQLLGHASVVGLVFSAASLEPLAEDAGANLDGALAVLHERHLIRPVDTPTPSHEFTFDHVLVREVAYEMLPKAVRARKHIEVASAIEASEEPLGKRLVFALADHYGRAATLAAEVNLEPEELDSARRAALAHGIAAGDAAAELFSNEEALDRYHAASGYAAPGDEALFTISERCGDAELRLGRVDAAIESWQRSLAHSRSRGEPEHTAELHRKMASALVRRGEPDEAVRHLQRGIKLVRDMRPSRTLVRLFSESATLYAQAGANMLAAYAAERALSIAEQFGDERAAGHALTIHGRVLGRTGDTAQARRSLDRAIELARASDPQETILALLATGRYLDQCEGDYASAHERYSEALGLARLTSDVPMQIELHAAIAQLALYRCDWQEAECATRHVTELAEEQALTSRTCLADVLRGRLRWRAGDLEQSASMLSAARAAARRLGLSEVSVQALVAHAATLADLGRVHDASRALEDAIALCERAGLTPQAAESCAALARIRAREERHAAALEVVARCRALASGATDPVSRASWLETQGIVGGREEGLQQLELARETWSRLERPLDAVRCLAERANRLRADDPASAERMARDAEVLLGELGLAHVAASWHELSAVRA